MALDDDVYYDSGCTNRLSCKDFVFQQKINEEISNIYFPNITFPNMLDDAGVRWIT